MCESCSIELTCCKIADPLTEISGKQHSGRITGLYEKVIKVKADVAAVLDWTVQLIGINIVFLASLSTTAETGWLYPRCRASIRTLNGPLCGPGACWGPISRPRSVTDDGPGL